MYLQLNQCGKRGERREERRGEGGHASRAETAANSGGGLSVTTGCCRQDRQQVHITAAVVPLFTVRLHSLVRAPVPMAGSKFQYDESGGTFFYFLLSFLALVVVPCTYYFWPKEQKHGESGRAHVSLRVSRVTPHLLRLIL